MLKRSNQLEISFSPYKELYDILIPKNNKWRRMKEEIDFSFIYDELKDSYSEDMGRTAKNVIFMFKLLLLKTESKLSDVGLINMVVVNMEYKYFLDLDPEETELIDPSLLTKFRRTRLAKYETDEKGNQILISDKSEDLLDILINKTVDIALVKGIIKKKNIGIVDSTHSLSMYGSITPREKLIKVSKELRKCLYKLDETIKEKMPKKREASGLLEDEILYCNELLEIVEKDGRYCDVPNIEENINLLKEVLGDINEQLEYSKDSDAKVGHKTADTSFFGYKTHMMMTAERIITAAKVTSGEKHDGKQLEDLIKKTQSNGIELEAVVGDGAYSENDNLEYCENEEIKNVSNLSKNVTHGNGKNKDNFQFNKDAEMYVCKAGEMAIRKAKQGSKKDKNGINSQVECYYFDVDKCKCCPFKEGCYKEESKTKTFSVKIKSEIHTKQMDYMETEEFKEYYKERYKIEAKNSEIKNVYNYGEAFACGKTGMTIQGATTLFLANMNRIYRLEDEKRKEKEEKNIENNTKIENNKNQDRNLQFLNLIYFFKVLFQWSPIFIFIFFNEH